MPPRLFAIVRALPFLRSTTTRSGSAFGILDRSEIFEPSGDQAGHSIAPFELASFTRPVPSGASAYSAWPPPVSLITTTKAADGGNASAVAAPLGSGGKRRTDECEQK